MRSRLGSTVTVTDLFCGAGGSSIGATRAGVELRMAANHWSLAIETHNTNFPDAAHDCADVSQVEPRRYPRTDILLASPECTHHSQARSHKHTPDLFDPEGDPAAERSRATMWDVVRFAEVHRYQAIVVENVVEVRRWPPFDAWLAAMDSLGYEHEVVYLNSMVAHPTPQSRDRLYVVFWRQGNRRPDLRIGAPAWCPRCESRVEARQAWKRAARPHGKYRQQYVYACPRCGSEAWPLVYPAASAIDWSVPCPRIGDRSRPLAPATRRRVKIGLERFGPAMFADQAAPPHGLVVETAYSGDRHRTPSWTPLPLPTQTARQSMALALPAFFVKNYGSASEAKYRPHPVEHPLGAVTAQDSHSLVTVPFVMVNRSHNRPRGVDEPLAPVLTADHQAVVVPFIAELRGGHSTARSVAEPTATVTASGQHHGLVVPPFFYVKNFGDGGDPSMAHPVTDPLGAVTAVDHHSLVAAPPAYLMSYYRTGRLHPVAEPVGTVSTRDRHALVIDEGDVDECGFRMLEPHEIQAAMAFPDTYVVLGNKRDRVKQLGNAVTPPAMALLVQRVLATFGVTEEVA